MAIDNDIMVSVVCVTYNHADYIRRTLAEFIKQETSFTVEYIVHDDCSTDGTTEIVKNYANTFPDLIKPIFESENQYSKHVNVGRLTFDKCKGKYIAFCEGDDFWIDPTKIQRQVEYMEAHPDCSICGHNTIQFNAETGEISNYSRYYTERDLTPEEILSRKGGTFHTSSFLMRREVLQEYYEDKAGFFTTVGLSDMCMRAFALTKGNVHFMDRTMSVYRRFLPGSWTSRNMSNGKIEDSWFGNIKIVNFFVNYDNYTEGIYHKEILDYIWRYIEIMVSEKISRNISSDLFLRLIESSREEYGTNLSQYLDLIKERYFRINDDVYWEEIVKKYKADFEFVIYGMGDYGHIALGKMIKLGITPKCFVVSNRDKISLKDNEIIPIVEFDKLDVDKEKTVIIMGVNTNNEIEIGDIGYPYVEYPFSNINR